MKFSSIQKIGESVLMNSLVTACSIFICISSNQSGCKIQFWGCCNTPLAEVSFRNHTQIAMAPIRSCSPGRSPSPFFILSFCLLSFLAALAASFLSLLERCLCAEEEKGRGRIRGGTYKCVPLHRSHL